LLRRRALRHVRAGVRPALPVRLAERQVRRHGAAAARRGAVHRRPAVGGGEGTALRRRGGRGAARHGGAADRVRVPADVPVRAAVRRRRHRPARHPHRPRPVPVRDPHRPLRGRTRRLRRLPDVRPMITTLLVANRGEIACRVMRTCRAMGIRTVAVHSDADADALHTREADAAVRLPGTTPADTYLRGDLVVKAALAAGADAVHPGYGFLSENPGFARAVRDAGLTWIGPPPEAIEAMASKTRAKELMGVEPLKEVTEADLPVLVKAAAGGGGRGMRVVRRLADLDAELAAARAEAASAFGDGEVFTEPYVEGGRHVEVQVLADTHGTVW